MLKDVLYEISKMKIYSPSLIGKNLGLSEAIVEELIGQLIRMGYLTEDKESPTCDSKCGSCAYASVCNSFTVTTFTISKKGQELLERLAVS